MNLLNISDIKRETNSNVPDLGGLFLNENILQHLSDLSRPIGLENDEGHVIDVTIMDLFEFPDNLSDPEMIEFIYKKTNIDISGNYGLKKINDLYQKAIDIYKQRYLKNIPFKYFSNKTKESARLFDSQEDVLNFLKETKTHNAHKHINCAISKIIFSINEIMDSPIFLRRRHIGNKFIEKISVPIQIDSGREENGVLYRNGIVTINGKKISFQIIARVKSLESTMGKEIADPKYYAVDQLKDNIGATCYVDNLEDALALMEYFGEKVYSQNYEIEQANTLSADILKSLQGSNQIFYDNINIALLRNGKKGKMSSDNLKVLKMKGKVDLPFERNDLSSLFEVGTEIGFIIGEEDNEKGLSLQSIYDYGKRFRELTRLGIPITDHDIISYINDFFKNLESNLARKNKHYNDYIVELQEDLIKKGFIVNDELNNNEKIEKTLSIGLFRYYRSHLEKVNVKGAKYYVHKRALDLEDVGMYPKTA